jgi:hypothetical protein
MGPQEVRFSDPRSGASMACAHQHAQGPSFLSLVERIRCEDLSVPKSRVMGDCHARFRERLGV